MYKVLNKQNFEADLICNYLSYKELYGEKYTQELFNRASDIPGNNGIDDVEDAKKVEFEFIIELGFNVFF